MLRYNLVLNCKVKVGPRVSGSMKKCLWGAQKGAYLHSLRLVRLEHGVLNSSPICFVRSKLDFFFCSISETSFLLCLFYLREPVAGKRGRVV